MKNPPFSAEVPRFSRTTSGTNLPSSQSSTSSPRNNIEGSVPCSRAEGTRLNKHRTSRLTSDQQLFQLRSTYFMFNEKHDQAYLQISQLQEFWPEVCSTKNVLPQFAEGDLELLNLFIPMVNKQYAATGTMDYVKVQNAFRAWTAVAMEIREARSKILELCEVHFTSKTFAREGYQTQIRTRTHVV
eukprot:TRINITY_DN901_c0_g3_i12.p1 TRINITY_DN901_c0_g3~~TRINITY_DN901_c0_g3_i12.p1  ORF type:complete len:186 (+),score=18.29 TRINITY_DN901_c0_g3_i12:314-871(+)